MNIQFVNRNEEHDANQPNRQLMAVITLVGSILCHDAVAEPIETGSALDQSGMDNSAVITQVNLSEGMYAHIIQSGTGQDASIYQSGPVEDFLTAAIEQSGSSNVATTEQADVIYHGSLVVYQDGNDNTATAIQTASYEAEGNIEQIGDLNQTILYQADTYSTATIRQEGTSNMVNVNQSGIEVYFQNANLEQVGDNNTINVLQDRMGMNQSSFQQIGNGNYAEIHQWQSGDVSFGIADIQATVSGNDNTVLVEQAANPIGHFTLDLIGNQNRIELVHGGESANVDMVSHYSNNNTDIIDQQGLVGNIGIHRYNTDNSSTDIVQDAFYEVITIEQGNSDNVSITIQQLSLLTSEILVRQLSSRNTNAFIDQGSAISRATIEQHNVTTSGATIRQDSSGGTGADLVAAIYQTDGSDLATAEIQQTNTLNVALIEQAGVTGTDALIVQTGVGGNATIVQTGLGGGVSNSASITQAGENYSASIHQNGSNNTATVAQM